MGKGPERIACPAEHAVSLVGGKWKIPILWHLFGGEMRFSELHRALGGVTQKVLIAQLRELESDGLVTRKVFAQVPPRVEYGLTRRGKALRKAIGALCEWSQQCRRG